MAYYLLTDEVDWTTFQPLDTDRGRPMVLYDEEIDRGEIPEIIEDWGWAVAEYFRFQRYGSPFGRGYLEWPCYLVDLFDEIASAEARKMKELRDGRGKVRGKT